MNEQIRLHLLGGAEREFDVSAVHGIAGLKCDYAAPSQAGKFGAQLSRSEAQAAEVVMRRRL